MALQARLAEIRKRKAEIRTALEAKEDVDLDAVEKELRDLNEEEQGIEKRQKIADGITVGDLPTGVVEKQKPEERQKPKEEPENKLDTPEYRHAFMQYVCRNTPIPAELRADAVTNTSDVGALVPPVTLNKIIEKIEAWGMILPLVNRTSYMTGMIIPTATIKPTATWVAEGAGSEKQKKALDASITFGHFKLRVAVAVTLETDYMAYSAFETSLVNNMAEAMGKAIEQAILNGTGTGQPTGILTDTTKGATVTANTLNYQTLINAEAALPMEYENGAVWCMTKKTFMQFVGMVDANGQPIANVTRGIASAPERTLFGRTVVLTNYLDSFAETLDAGKVYAFLYNFKDYTLNTNFQIGMKIYEDNETDDIVRKSIMVCDGKPIVYESLVKLVRGE